MSMTFETTYEGRWGHLHNLEVSGFWQDRDQDEITGPKGQVFIPEQVRLLWWLPGAKRWKRRLLPDLHKHNYDLWCLLSEEADEVMRDMAWEAGYDG